MSGNFVQRGELAAMPKQTRAKAAIECGCDLVLELPFPWSCSSAEFFASAGVSIANSCGVFDLLCFGCESLKTLEPEENLNLINIFRQYNYNREKLNLNGAVFKLIKAQELYKNKFGINAFYPDSPNDILAVGYIKALDNINSSIIPMPLIRDPDFSATASRSAWERGDLEKLNKLVPEIIIKQILDQNKIISLENLSQAILAYFKLADPKELSLYCDSEGGLAQWLCKSAQKAISIKEFLNLCSAKHLTSAKIRRAAIFCFFKINYLDLEKPPPFSNLLGANERGRNLLNKIKFPVITKPADAKKYGAETEEAYNRNQKADNIYGLAAGIPQTELFKIKPYIK